MNKGFAKYRLIILVIVLIVAFLFKNFYRQRSSNSNASQTAQQTIPGLDRNTNHLILTKHARCRMDCRHITEDELKEILHEGNINNNKTNLEDERGASYALEGYTHEQQHLRVVFAPESDGLVVVTCIDLDKEWQCDCN